MTSHLDYTKRAYYNTNSKNWTIQEKTSGGWRKVSSVTSGVLTNVHFKVFEAGRERVLREKRKNVHAYAYFDEISPPDYTSGETFTVRYNPYSSDKFMVVPMDRFSPFVKGAKIAHLSSVGSNLTVEEPELICRLCDE